MPRSLWLVPCMKVMSYKDLNVWMKAMELTDKIYDVTASFPKEELFALSNQMRRAAVSVASNIAEGSVRGTKEFGHFINISRGSVAELETQILIAERRKFIEEEYSKNLQQLTTDISKMLMGLNKSLKQAIL